MSDHADTIRLALDHLIQQDRFEAPYADAAQSALDALLAENQRWETRAWNAERRKAAVEAENQWLRDALQALVHARFDLEIPQELWDAALAAVRVEDDQR